MKQYNDEAGTAIAIILDPSLTVIALRTFDVSISDHRYHHLQASLGEVLH
ncbi:MAG: hypothetical protein M3114_00820 [Thermoproteota archaeon]|nr:hypothetical protein [Thermoproteota archaeon]